MAKKNKYTIEQIEPLIISQEQEQRKLFMEFGLPGAGPDEIYEVQHTIKRARDAGSRIKERMTRTGVMYARRGAVRAVRRGIGGGIAGRMVGQTMNQASREVRPEQNASQKEVNQAVIEAFEKVAKYFHWDEASETWGKPGIPPPPPPKSPFEEQLAANPIADPHDKNIFARVMAELAYADGHIAPEEAEFFKEIIPPDQPNLDVLAKADPVSTIEAQEVTEGVKGTIYMFAWVIALIDLDLDGVEEELLMEYADVFKLTDASRQELTKHAKYFVLEKNIDPDIPRDELFQIATKIGLSNDDAERCRIAYKRRVG